MGCVLGCALSCSVESASQATGGVVLGERGPNDCDRALALVQSDYNSTNIAISNLDGTTLSGSFVSSGSKTPGLSLAISGDVDLPYVAPEDGNLVILDRYGTNVVTWMDVASASAIAQLPIGQGFESNPQDYIEVAGTAFVSRFGSNPAPGALPFDEGGDLLLIDLTDRKAPAITGRIAIPEEDPDLDPRPSGMMRLDSELIVTLARSAPDFSRTGHGRIVGVSTSTRAISWTLELNDLYSCGRVAIAKDHSRFAIACSSAFNPETKRYEPSGSDLVLFDATVHPPKEIKRAKLSARLNAALQPAIAFASSDIVLVKTFGGMSTPGDTLVALDLRSDTVTTLATSQTAYAFNDVRCSPGCNDMCLMADAESNVLRRFQLESDGRFTELSPVTVETRIGLPPRSFGAL